jgi:hypothetical protein
MRPDLLYLPSTCRYLQTVIDSIQLNMQTAVQEKQTLHGILGLHPEVNGITECRLCPKADCFVECVCLPLCCHVLCL